MVIDKLIVGTGRIIGVPIVSHRFAVVSTYFPMISMISQLLPLYFTKISILSHHFHHYFPLTSLWSPHYVLIVSLPYYQYFLILSICRYYFTIFFRHYSLLWRFHPARSNMLKLSNLTSLSIIWSSKYPLVMTNTAMENHYFYMGKSTISMAIFNTLCNKLPEGNPSGNTWIWPSNNSNNSPIAKSNRHSHGCAARPLIRSSTQLARMGVSQWPTVFAYHKKKKNEMSFRHCSAVSHTSRGRLPCGQHLERWAKSRDLWVCIRICRDWVPRLTRWFPTFFKLEMSKICQSHNP